jgi:predicted molibdopterin-dependent oxidoreductase YjgC
VATVTINGLQVECADGSPLVEVIKNAGIWISNLCYIDGLPPYAGCRTCLVEIEDARGLQLSCTTTVRDGMVVRTNSSEVTDARRMVISLINANHPDRCLSCHRRIKCKPGDICLRDDVVTHRCLTCSKNYRCELQTTNELAEMQQFEPFTGEDRSYYGRTHQPERDVYNPYLEFDPQMCILCTRCVRACDDLHNTQAITLAGKGWQTRIAFGAPGPGANQPPPSLGATPLELLKTRGRDGYVHESNCDFCGTCIDVCPTAALMEHPNKWVANTSTWTPTACNYCAVGCSVKMGTRNGKGVIVRPDVETNDFSRDQICVRGRFHYDEVSDADRLSRPLRRRGETLTATTWENALDHVTEQLAGIVADAGPGAVAFLGSPYATTEENFLLAQLAQMIGSPNLDSSAGPVARAVAEGLVEALSSETLPNDMTDFQRATTLVVCAQDIEQTHPVASTRLKDGVLKNGARLIYVSPRYGELCDFAHAWLQAPPGLEAATLLRLAQEVVWRSNPPRREEAAAEEGEEAPSSLPEGLLGVSELLREEAPALPPELEASIKEAAATLVEGRGQTDRGPMAFVLAPPEVDPLSAGAQTRALVDLALVSAGPGNGPLWTHILPHQPNVNGMREAGVAGERDFNAIRAGATAGTIKAVLALRDNPLFSAPDRAATTAALQQLDLLVVIDEILTDTARMAHVVLPDVSAWSKDGTMVSADRRLMRQNAAVSPVDDARPAWWMLNKLGASLASRLGQDTTAWQSSSAAAVMERMAEANPRFAEGPYCENSSGIRQTAQHPSQVRVVPVRSPASTLNPGGDQLALITHRGQFTSFEAAQLRKPDADRLRREEYALINPSDAARLGAGDFDIALVRGDAGSLEIPLLVSQQVMAGTLFVPLYYDGGALMSLLPEDPRRLVAPALTVELTGRRSDPPPDPVAQRQPEASGVEVIPLEQVLTSAR